MNSFWPLVASLALMAISLWGWRTTYASQCASLGIPLLAIAIIGYQAAQYAIYRRRCFANCFFTEGSPLHRFYHGAAIAVLVAVMLSVVAGLSLMLNLLTWSVPVLLLLAIDGVVVAAVAPRAMGFLAPQLRPAVAGKASRSLLASVNTLLLLPIVLVVQYHAPFPSFLDQASLANTIAQAYQSLGSQCVPTNLMVKFHAAKEGVTWWLMLRASVALSDPTYRWAAWTLFLISGSLSVWAYSRLVVQVADFARQRSSDDG